MRKKVAVALVAILVALFIPGVAFATHVITGEVIWANPAMRALMINAQGQEITFSVADDVVDDLVDLMPGARVAVRYTQADGDQPLCHHVFPWPIGG